MRRAAICLVLLLGGGAALAADADLAADLEGHEVIAVDFEADEPLDDRSLRELLPLRPGGTFSRAGLDESVQLLRWKDVWSTIEPEVTSRPGGVAVVFRLRIRRTIASVTVSGYHAFYQEDLVRRVRIATGTPFEAEVVEEAATRLRDYYRRQGFPEAGVAVHETEAAHRQVHLDFEVDEGQPVVVEAVVLEGDLGAPLAEIDKALGVRAGERRVAGLERDVKRRAQAFYRQRDYFDADIAVTWEAQSPTGGILLVEVQVGPKVDIRFAGNETLSRDTLLGLIDLNRRPVITDATWRELGRRIEKEYRLRGFYRARVDLTLGEEGETKTIDYSIEEGRRYVLRRVEFVGDEQVPATTLESVMTTRPETWVPYFGRSYLDDERINNDLRQLWFLYRRLGFQSAEVLDARPAFDDEAGAVDLTIEVSEGPRSMVRGVSLEVAQPIILPPLATKVDEPYSPEDEGADAEALAKALSRLGYPEARVDREVDEVRAGKEVETTVLFRANPGPYRQVGPVVVHNNFITKDRVVLRELPFEEGTPYDPQALIEGQTNVYRLGLFRGVRVRPVEGGDPAAPAVAVEVDEAPAGTLSYGFGYESDIGVRLFGEAAYANLQGMNRRLSLRGDFSWLPTDSTQTQYIANLGFRSPRVFDTYWVSRSNAIFVRNTLTLNRFSLEGLTLATALERELVPWFIVGGIFEWDQADTFDVAADANLAPEGVKDVGFLRQVGFGPFLELDRRDDPFAPRSGTLDTAEIRYYAKALNSDISFLSMSGKHTQYVPLGEYLTFVYALRGAWALPFDGEFSVPIRDRYFVGGRTTVRGFEENSIAPLGAQNDPIGGDIMLTGNAEMRFPLVFGLGAAVFFDTGGTFLRQPCTKQVCNFSDLGFDNMRRSVGIGLRYLTPVGPISLEYGFKLDRRDGESLGAFHFTIGNIF